MACSALITAADWHAHHARSRHRESRARRSRAASGTGRYEESIRRVVNADNTARLRSEELSKGFCNSVHLVRGVNGDDEALVVKLYSDLSLLRTESDQRGAVDKIASVFGLGPTVWSSTHEGIAHSFVPGRVLEEVDMHTRSDVGVAAARLVARFHSLQVPREFDAERQPLLWKWFDRMLDEIGASDDVGVLPDSVNLDVLRAEVKEMRESITSAGEMFTVVLAHGDLKPANVMLQNDAPVELKLIDLELSGPNYRGFDLMKLFRTNSETFSEEKFTAFLSEYCRAARLDENAVRNIEAETKLFEPLTWLEAAVFFALVVVLGTDAGGPSGDSARWLHLLHSRFDSYLETRQLFAHHMSQLTRAE